MRFLFFVCLPTIAIFSEQTTLKKEDPSEITLVTSCENEALYLQRICEFYEEKEFAVVLSQGQEFLKKFPKSAYADDIHVLLGDLYLQDKKHDQAISSYLSVINKDKKQTIFINLLDCYYHNHDYEKLTEACKEHLESKVILDKDTKEKIHHIYALTLFKWMQEDQTKSYRINEAISLFDSLINTVYDSDAKEHLAFLFTEKKAYKKSTDLYLELAEKNHRRKEEFLFLAAENARNFDTHLAIKTYIQICCLSGKLKHQAALNRLLLSYEDKRYAEILVTKKDVEDCLEEKDRPLLQYYVASSHYELEQYEKAVPYFKEFLGSFCDAKLKEQTLYFLLSCAQRTKDLSTLSFVIDDLKKAQSSSPLYLEALFSRAILQKENKNLQSADKDFQAVLDSPVVFDKKAEMLFEWAHMHLERKDYSKARSLFKEVIATTSDKKLSTDAYESQIYSSVQMAEKDQTEESKILLEKDLEGVLSRKENPSCPSEYVYLLGKVRYQLGKNVECRKALEKFIAIEPKDPKVPDALVLIGYTYKDKDWVQFARYLEKALKHEGPLGQKETIHSSLYNAYHQISKNLQMQLKEKHQKDKRYQKALFNAADHLYALHLLCPEELSDENRLWLASYYHIQAKRGINRQTFLQRGTNLFENALRAYENKSFTEKDVHLESHYLRLVELLQLSGKKAREIEVLVQLKQNYEKTPDIGWEFQNKTYYYLANALKKQDAAGALLLFEKVGKSPYTKTNYTNLSLLEAARLLKEKYKELSKDDPKYIELVVKLKTLALKRSIDTEPVHLEASLELIDLLAGKKDPTYAERKMHLYQEMKKNFSNQQDVLSKDYHTMKSRLPKKKQIYDTYMSYIDRQILLLKSTMCEKEEKQSLLTQAKRIYESMEKGLAECPFLKERLENIEG